MKKFLKIMLCIMGSLLAVIVASWFCISYTVNYKKTSWEVTWYEDYVEVILSGEEQFDEQVILYFDGAKETQQLTDTEAEYITGDELDESRVIAEQSFDVDLNHWGKARFVSYMPSDDIYKEDVYCRMSHIPVVCDRQIFMSDKIDMVISVALPPVASLSAPMLVAKKYVLSAVSI